MEGNVIIPFFLKKYYVFNYYVYLTVMDTLAEQLGRIICILEDAKEEQDWNLVQRMIDELDGIYESLENQSPYDFDI